MGATFNPLIFTGIDFTGSGGGSGPTPITTSLPTSGVAATTGITFDNTTQRAIIIQYKLIEAVTNNIRVGQIYALSNGTSSSITDNYTENASVGVTFSLNNSGSTTTLQYVKIGANTASFTYELTEF